jgi:hypothetical protein
MKSLKYSIIACLFVLFSCQKEDIRPNNTNKCSDHTYNNTEVNGMFQNSKNNQERSIDKIFSSTSGEIIIVPVDGNSSISSGSTNTSEGTDSKDGSGGITDPNNEPDASKRKGKK